jgi:WD40 repeat protein
MKRLPSLAAAVGTIALTGTMSFAVASGGGPSTTATTPSPTPEPSPTWAPSKTLSPADFKVGDITGDEVIPTPSPTWAPPAGYVGSLKPDDWVQISRTGSCLNVRISPALVFHSPEGDQPVPTLNCLPDGFVGQLSFGPWPQKDDAPPPMPVQADGHWWWNLLGQGWVAEDWLVAAEAPEGAQPALADAGLIAFMRADGVWLMNADGSELRLLYATDTLVSTVASIDWSPDGSSLAISMNTWAEMTTRYLTVLVATDGTVIAEYPGLSDANWSPDGTRLAGLRYTLEGAAVGHSTPVIVDLATGGDTAVGPTGWHSRGPEWSPDGSTVAYFCRYSLWEGLMPDGTVQRFEQNCEADGLRTVSVSDGTYRVIVPTDRDATTWYEGVSWSPNGASIATYSSGGACRGYAVIDVASAAQTTCLPIPEETNFGGCGIGIEFGASDWTPDGRTLAYHWQSGTGQNGVALVDVASGERRMIPTTGASSISFSADGLHLSYESAGYVWTAAADGTNVTRVTDGWLPMWQPAH